MVYIVIVCGSLINIDVLVQGGVICVVGIGLLVLAGVFVVEVGGKLLIFVLFGGIIDIGIDEVFGELIMVDSVFKLFDQLLWLEFDVSLVYNLVLVLILVVCLDGIGFIVLGVNSGGGFIVGQGGVVWLDGSVDLIGLLVLYVCLGVFGVELIGSFCVVQWMLLEQMVSEVCGWVLVDLLYVLFILVGCVMLVCYLVGQGWIVVQVDCVVDIC